MKKLRTVLAAILLLSLCLSGCAAANHPVNGEIPSSSEESMHTHSFAAATCTLAKICTECGDTEGDALGHTWQAATCISSKTCSVCGATEGIALGHIWQAATCSAPKTCSVCSATEGEPTEHVWKDATCTAPKTCFICQETTGETADHNWNAATCTTPKTCSTCSKTEGSAKSHSYTSGKCTSCSKSDPSYSSSGTGVWIPTNGGKKYHSKSSCSGMKDPIQVSKSEAIRQGFTDCKKCY